MSDYECKNHHLMKGSATFCEIWGEPKFYVDGMTRQQRNKMARDEELEMLGFPGKCDEIL